MGKRNNSKMEKDLVQFYFRFFKKMNVFFSGVIHAYYEQFATSKKEGEEGTFQPFTSHLIDWLIYNRSPKRHAK